LIYKLEDKIEKLLPPLAVLDGHEFGGGHSNVYLYGPSADAIMLTIRPIIDGSGFEDIIITLRFGVVDDLDAKEKKIRIK
jgi:hypothetical protein